MAGENKRGLDGILRDSTGKPVKDVSPPFESSWNPQTAAQQAGKKSEDQMDMREKMRIDQAAANKKNEAAAKLKPKPKSKQKISIKQLAPIKQTILLPRIIGAPLDANNEYTYNALRNSSLVATIVPCNSQVSQSISLFSLTSAMKEYRKRLGYFGYSVTEPNPGVQVCFQADSFPSDSFTNEYGDSMFSQLTNMVSAGGQEIAQILGGKTAAENSVKVQDLLNSMGLTGIAGTLKKGTESASNMIGNAGENSKVIKEMGKMLNAAGGGARASFPQVWKGSSFSSSYSFTIKLYNPSPGNPKASEYFINGPLTALLLLMLPIANPAQPKMFNQPYFCKVYCKGLFGMKQGVITGLNVIKGAENQVAFNQKLGLVDLKIDFAFIHSHMISNSKEEEEGIPSLAAYINQLKEGEEVRPMYDMWTPDMLAINESYLKDSAVPTVTNDLTTPPATRTNSSLSDMETRLKASATDNTIFTPPINSTSINSLTAEPSAAAGTIITQMPTTTQLAEQDKAKASKDQAPVIKRLMEQRAAAVIANRKAGFL